MRLIIPVLILLAAPAYAIEKCGSGKRVTCVVDGDTFWLDGVKIRMEGYDTPEPQTGICGGVREKRLAARATSRLIELMNSGYTVEFAGKKGHYKRELATVRVGGVDVGDILVAEGLARKWPDGNEFWCDDSE
jgi:endonuclease YncB( thermonuclease family)